MEAPRKPLFNDATALVIGDRLRARASLLKSIDPALWALFDSFEATHLRFTQRLARRRVCRSALPELRKKRRDCQKALEASLIKAWDNVPGVGSDFNRPKTRQEIRDQRACMCRYGRPVLQKHGVGRLCEMAGATLEYLTGSASLARAWPSGHLEELLAALEDLERADKALLEAGTAQSMAFVDLADERLLWARDFANLRDVTARYLRPGPIADHIQALFRDWTVERPETTRRKTRKARLQEEEERPSTPTEG